MENPIFKDIIPDETGMKVLGDFMERLLLPEALCIFKDGIFTFLDIQRRQRDLKKRRNETRGIGDLFTFRFALPRYLTLPYLTCLSLFRLRCFLPPARRPLTL